MKRIKPIKRYILGVDEAGRGAWAGPVVAACVSWTGKCAIKGKLGDSKKLTPAERERTFQEIIQLQESGKLQYGVGIISSSVIDEVGIREANRRAMGEALLQIQKEKFKKKNDGSVSVIPGTQLQSVAEQEHDPESRLHTSQSDSNKKDVFLNHLDPDFHRDDGNFCLMIDGRDNYRFDIPGLPKPEYIVRGDDKIKQIMAASIIAKVTRDSLMTEYALRYPGYGFDQHKGYGTVQHQAALKKLGVCGIHRRSYEPVKICIGDY